MDTVNSKEHHLIENHTNPIKKEEKKEKKKKEKEKLPKTKLFPI